MLHGGASGGAAVTDAHIREVIAAMADFGKRPGRYYPSTSTVAAGAVVGINEIYFVPIDPILTPTMFDRLALWVTTGGAGSSAKFAVYANGTGANINLPVGAPVLVNNTGVATTTSAAGAEVTVSGSALMGCYWAAVKFTGTAPNVYCNSGASGGVAARIGNGSLNASPVNARTLADTYANNMPTLTGAESFGERNVASPVIWMRAA